MSYYKNNVASKNHRPKSFSLRELKRKALRTTNNIEEASIEYERLVKNLKKGFKI
jgi:hypothetical protein